MLDLYFHLPATRERHRAGAFAAFIDDFASWQSECGFCQNAAKWHIRTASAFSRWLADTSRPADAIDDSVIASFVSEFPTSGYLGHGRKKFLRVRRDVERFVSWMRETGHLCPAPPSPPLPANVVVFEAWMLQQRRIQARSLVGKYRAIVLRFLAVVGDNPTKYTASAIRAFILDQVPRLTRKGLQGYALVVRVYLRFHATQGACSADLIGAVPKFAQWRKDRLPKYLPPTEVERIINGCDRSTAGGRRNFAMLLLLARLGLRAGDVTGLCLSDVDWKQARIWVSGKGSRREALPLPQDVGDALLAYIESDRPRVDFDQVFVTTYAPYVPLQMKSLSTMVVRAAARVGVELPGTASHVLRHSLATSLLAEGVSLSAIGAVLRHRSLDTTTIYAKVDTNLLRAIAPPWPIMEVR